MNLRNAILRYVRQPLYIDRFGYICADTDLVKRVGILAALLLLHDLLLSGLDHLFDPQLRPEIFRALIESFKLGDFASLLLGLGYWNWAGSFWYPKSQVRFTCYAPRLGTLNLSDAL